MSYDISITYRETRDVILNRRKLIFMQENRGTHVYKKDK